MNAAQQTIALLLVSLFLAGCIDAATPEAEGQGDTSGTVAGTTVVNNYYAYSNYTNVTTPEPTIYYRNGVANFTESDDIYITIHQNSGEWLRVQGLSNNIGSAVWECSGYPDGHHNGVGDAMSEGGIAGADCDVVFRVQRTSSGSSWVLSPWAITWMVQPVVAG